MMYVAEPSILIPLFSATPSQIFITEGLVLSIEGLILDAKGGKGFSYHHNVTKGKAD